MNNENRTIKFNKNDISLSNLLTEMQNNIYEYDNDVQFALSKKYIKNVIKKLKNVSISKNEKETTIAFLTNSKIEDTEYMVILVGDNKTDLYSVKQVETNDKQYQGLNRDYSKKTNNIITFTEEKEILKTNNIKR